MIRLATVALVTLAFASWGTAQTSFGLRVGAGQYYPSSRLVREAFGDTWSRFSFSPGGVRLGRGLSTDFDVEALNRESFGNRVTLFSPTYGLSYSFNDNPDAVPFVAARVGPTFADYRIAGVSRRPVLWNTNIEAGIVLNERLRLFARYDLYTKRDGVDFSGFSINAEWLLVRF